MKNRKRKLLEFLGTVFFLTILGFGVHPTAVRGAVDVSFLYRLSNFSGPIPYNWAAIHVDEERDEIYVLDSGERDITIFNETGMEIYRFGDSGSLGSIIDFAVKEDGSILVLTGNGRKSSLTLCNFRGEPLSEITLRNVPTGFSPDRISYREERLYFLDKDALSIVVTDADGLFIKGYDIASLLKIEEGKRAGLDIDGFNVDGEGNMLFTIPPMFSAYRLSPDGTIAGFGTPGGAPGRFGVVGGIVADEEGHYYVADRLKSVVLIFDKDFTFLKEFGYRGFNPDNLMGPKNLALDREGRLYVSQFRNRGVSVFKVAFD